MTVGYERQHEQWIECTYSEMVSARETACEHLGIEHRQNLSNTELCGMLGLPADVSRPQRLIKWANEQISRT